MLVVAHPREQMLDEFDLVVFAPFFEIFDAHVLLQKVFFVFLFRIVIDAAFVVQNRHPAGRHLGEENGKYYRCVQIRKSWLVIVKAVTEERLNPQCDGTLDNRIFLGQRLEPSVGGPSRPNRVFNWLSAARPDPQHNRPAGRAECRSTGQASLRVPYVLGQRTRRGGCVRRHLSDTHFKQEWLNPQPPTVQLCGTQPPRRLLCSRTYGIRPIREAIASDGHAHRRLKLPKRSNRRILWPLYQVSVSSFQETPPSCQVFLSL